MTTVSSAIANGKPESSPSSLGDAQAVGIVFTIGYGGRSPQELLDRLASQAVQAVVDVRISPRGHLGAFTRSKSAEKGIQGLLGQRGIRYYWAEAFGNRYRDADDWRTLYQEYLDSHWDTLRDLLYPVPQPYCLLCAEKLPEHCHRAYIAERLASPTCQVVHL